MKQFNISVDTVHNISQSLVDYIDDDSSWNTGGGAGANSPNAKLIFQQPSEALQVFGKTVEVLNVFGIPIIIVVGIFGNCLSLLVFLLTPLRKQSSTIYLAFLNIVDTLFLLCLIITWLGFLDIHLIHFQGWCQTVIYLSYVSSFSSVYTVAGFTVERWLVVYYPLKRNAWCSRKKATIVVFTIVLVAIVMYSYTTWTYAVVTINFQHIKTTICMPKMEFYVFVQIMSGLDTILTLLIPSIVIIIFNVFIMLKIWRFLHTQYDSNRHMTRRSSIRIQQQDELDTLQGQGSMTLESSSMSSSRRIISSRYRQQLRTTRSLIIVSTTFVILNVPSHAFRIVATAMEILNPEFHFSTQALLFQHICQIENNS